MNKQELIKELKEEKRKIEWKEDKYELHNAASGGKERAYSLAIDLAKELDEQIKVVVPRSVAEMIEIYREKEINLAYLMRYFKGWHNKVNKGTMDSKALSWIVNNLEEFLDAWIHGYEVEKEQLYYVFDTTTKQYLGVDKVVNKAFWLSSQNSGARTPLTEQEIKSVDERYWQFAVKVDGE